MNSTDVCQGESWAIIAQQCPVGIVKMDVAMFALEEVNAYGQNCATLLPL